MAAALFVNAACGSPDVQTADDHQATAPEAFAAKTDALAVQETAGRDTPEENAKTPGIPATTSIFKEPSAPGFFVSGPKQNFYYNPTAPVPNGTFAVSQNFSSLSGSDAFITGWNLGTWTGFFPTLGPTTQIGVNPAWQGSTGTQIQGTSVGILVHSDSITNGQTILGTNFPFVSAYNYDWVHAPIFPWKADIHAGLVFASNLQVPYASAANDQTQTYPWSAVYMGGVFALVDTTSCLPIWYSSQMYDHRGTAREYLDIDRWQHEDGTWTQGWASVTSVVTTPGQYLNQYTTPVWGSSSFHGTTWSGYQNMSFAITGDNLVVGIKALNTQFPWYSNSGNLYNPMCPENATLSTNPANYVIAEVNFGPELHYNGGFGVIGVSYNNFDASIVSSLPITFYRMASAQYQRHMYTTSVNEVNSLLSTGWAQEGNAGQLYQDAPSGTSLIPLYRLFDTASHDSFYTTSLAEAQGAVKSGNYEFYPVGSSGIAGYLPNQTGCSVDLYRVNSPGTGHFYTTSLAEAEGIQGGTIEATYCINP